ncbi:MAG: hypothetical protein ACRD19_08350 [Terriglobia bacterium]
MTTTHVNEVGIVFRRFNPLDQPVAGMLARNHESSDFLAVTAIYS